MKEPFRKPLGWEFPIVLFAVVVATTALAAVTIYEAVTDERRTRKHL